MLNDDIRTRLAALSDAAYADFQRKLIPNVNPAAIIGVRTPALRTFAKQLVRESDVESFLAALPHTTFDENQLHAFIISETKDYGLALRQVEQFLPFIDNWATCDQLSPKSFRKHPEDLLPHVMTWLGSKGEYTVRFAICTLMRYFLDDLFEPSYAELVAQVQREEYYVRMMQAWYFATALAKQYESILPFIEQQRLEPWTHNKAIQKAIESYRVSDAHKAYLKTLRRKA